MEIEILVLIIISKILEPGALDFGWGVQRGAKRRTLGLKNGFFFLGKNRG